MRRIAGIALVALVLVAGGCRTGPSAADWIAAGDVAVRAAEKALAGGDGASARRVLEEFLDAPRPSDMAADDRRVLVQDAAFRLADVELRAGRAEAARAVAERGLAEGRGVDVFTANLLVARGRAFEALGRPGEAVEDYHAALVVNEALLAAALGGGTR